MEMQMPDRQPSYFEFLMKNRGVRGARPLAQATSCGRLPVPFALGEPVRGRRMPPSSYLAHVSGKHGLLAPAGWSPRRSAVIDEPKLWSGRE
jgi:hypothetical protein